MGQFPCLRISDGEPPLGLLMICCDLSGDVGDDGSESGKLAGVVRECGEGVHIHANIDDSTPSFGLLASKEVEQHIGPELVHRASLAGASKTLCELVDPPRDGANPVRWQIQAQQVRCSLVGRFGQNPTIGKGLVVALLRLTRVGLESHLAYSSRQLAGGEPRRWFGDALHRALRCSDRKVSGAPVDHPGAALINDPGREHLGDLGDPLMQVQGK